MVSPRRRPRRTRADPETATPDLVVRGDDPAAIGDLLDAAVRRRRAWEPRLRGARVHALWPQIAGTQLAAHTEPVRLRGGVLVVRADSSVWATQVRYLAAELAERANAVLGAGQVTKVTVTSGPLKGGEG